MMESRSRARVGDVTDHVTCSLCHGYLVDAVTVVRCLHTFCRSCLIQRLSDVKQCPLCALVLDENRLSKEIRRDHILQKLVYKSVPGLLTSELKRRRDFMVGRRHASGDDVTMTSQQCLLPADMSTMTSLCADDDDVSVCLHMVGSSGTSQSDGSQLEPVRRRYLLCPVSTSVSLLKKFVFLKLDLTDHQHAVEVFHNGELLEEFYTLMDVAYIAEWDRSGPLTLDYVVVRRSIVRPASTETTSDVRQPTTDRDEPLTASVADAQSACQPTSLAATSSTGQLPGHVVSKPSTTPTSCDGALDTAQPQVDRGPGRDRPDAVDTAQSMAEQGPSRDSWAGGSESKVLERRTEKTSSSSTRQKLSGGDDDCLSISTSVTVVISRRPPVPGSASDSTPPVDEHTDPALTDSAHKQLVVNATIPSTGTVPQSLAFTAAQLTAATSKDSVTAAPVSGSVLLAATDPQPSSHVTSDVTHTSAGSRAAKRKSLESVIQSLQPTPVATPRPPEVVKSRPEVLVRPMQACAGVVAVSSVPGVGRVSAGMRAPCSQAADMRRAKHRPTQSALDVTCRRKHKSVSPLQAPPGDDRRLHPAHSSADKRRRYTTSVDVATGRFHTGYCFPPPPVMPAASGLPGRVVAAAAAAGYQHAYLAAAARLPLYYHHGPSHAAAGGPQLPRAEPNGYDAPLELTTKLSRDRK